MWKQATLLLQPALVVAIRDLLQLKQRPGIYLSRPRDQDAFVHGCTAFYNSFLSSWFECDSPSVKDGFLKPWYWDQIVAHSCEWLEIKWISPRHHARYIWGRPGSRASASKIAAPAVHGRVFTHWASHFSRRCDAFFAPCSNQRDKVGSFVYILMTYAW